MVTLEKHVTNIVTEENCTHPPPPPQKKKKKKKKKKKSRVFCCGKMGFMTVAHGLMIYLAWGNADFLSCNNKNND